MNRCIRCVLPENFPGIQFDESGVCQYCRRMPSPGQRESQRAQLRVRFEELVRKAQAGPGYHCLVSWSGGKDSTYTLWLLKKQYELNMLAFTFDNGFVPGAAFENMRVVSEQLNIDHVIVRPRFDFLRRVFVGSIEAGMYPPKALERASGICNSCMGLAKGIALRIALERGIPLLIYGWSPGQIPLASTIFATNSRMLRVMIQAAMAPLESIAGSQVATYFPEDRQLDHSTQFPYNVSPLLFLEYDEETALHAIQALGWRRPQDTDPNSTNCLLNCLGNAVHLEQMGYHPYVMELAGLVREGYMSREDALAKLEFDVASEAVATVRTRLGI